MKKSNRIISRRPKNNHWFGKPSGFNTSQFARFSVLLVLLFSLSACYERVDGCLDIYAANYEANADDPCAAEDECCNYPELKLSLSHLFGELPYDNDSVFYFNGTSDSLRFVEIIYYLSGAALSGPDGRLEITNEVEVEFDPDGESQTIRDDYVLVEYLKGTQYTWGNFATAGTYDSLHLFLGIPDLLATADPTSLPDNHELSIQSDTMWRTGQGYALMRLQLVSQANNQDTLTYTLPALGNGLSLSFPLDTSINFGTTTSIPMQVDYQKWLAGIDFVANGADTALVLAEIVKNLPNAISLAQ